MAFDGEVMHRAFIVPPVSEEVIDLHCALDELSERERLVLAMRFAGAATFEDVGVAIGVSSGRVQQIEKRALRRVHWRLRRQVQKPVTVAEPKEPTIADRLREYGRHQERVRAEKAHAAQTWHNPHLHPYIKEMALLFQQESLRLDEERQRREELRQQYIDEAEAVPEWGQGTVIVILEMCRVRWNEHPAESHRQFHGGEVLNVGVRLATRLIKHGLAAPA